MIRNCCSCRTLFHLPTFKGHQTRTAKYFIRNYSHSHAVKSISPTTQKIVGYSFGVCISAKQLFSTHNASCLQVHHHGNPYYDRSKQINETLSNHEQFRIVSVFGLTYKYLRLFIHLVWTCTLYGPLFTLYPLTVYMPNLTQTWLKSLLFLVEISGPTFIKLGQWASTRRDLFSADFCDIFSKLHTNAPAHSWRYTLQRMEEVFGKDWRQVFVMVDSVIHSGCIGQVHKAFMRSDVISKANPQGSGEEYFRILANESQELHDTNDKVPLIPVAIKILHPGVYSTVHWDLQLLHTLARLCSLIPGVKWLSLTECVEEFEALMKNQIDLIVEAKNLDQFNQNFSHVSSVKFPRPIWPFVTHDILVETYEEGESISTYIQMKDGPNGLKERLAEIGVNTLLKMVFVDNFVHADLHPGNILVQGISNYPSSDTDGNTESQNGSVEGSKGPVRLVLLDTGIVGHLSEQDRKNLHQVILAVAMGKGDVAAELMVNHARASECNDIEQFKADMAKLVLQVHKITLQLGQMQVGPLIQDVLNIFIRNKVKFESNFASILLAVMVLEGLGRSLDPKLDIFEAAKPVLLGRAM